MGKLRFRIRVKSVILMAMAGLVGCAEKPVEEDLKIKEDEKTPVAERRLVGRVASIPAERDFVLIQSYGTWRVASGSVVTTVGPEGRAANLRVTGEKLGQFAAADIQSGTLKVGDGVYTTPVPDPEALPQIPKRSGGNREKGVTEDPSGTERREDLRD